MNDTHPIFLTLKKKLKARKVSYAELAARLGMSEANVKRIFSEESCSVARLAQICDAIDLSLGELMRSAENVEPESFTFTREVESFFADNLDYFVFFRQLENENSLRLIQEKNDLSPKEINRYLRKLEELGLIERHPGDRVKLRFKGYLHLPKESRLMKKYFQRWVPHFFEKVMAPHEQHFAKIFSTGLSERNRKALVRDLEEISRKYQELGYFDQSKGTNPFEAVGVCIGIGPYRVGEGKLEDYRPA
jgi:DNA-binding Xre family transcriptional regulator/DNA-binding MarR family transcriptional regulator